VLLETFALFAAGLGLALGLAFTAISMLREPLRTIVPHLTLTPPVIFEAIALASLLALATGAAPAFNAMRIPPSAALRER